ncbi:MAG: hypothetical protein PHP95_08390 [Desulfuromonadaceae bacterium]|nr:hypothetical protein [Desulfuromonadaceae bacterium]MDD2848462.1 hypothetical protein [Desulfuromonadaceae bacterium]MDD4129909.1 hypothetical protein [Desulfuromonadaceae bacterium]
MASTHNDSITGTAALGAAFHLSDKHPSLSILTSYKERIYSGDLLNNCKQNYTSPTGFAEEHDETEQNLRLGACLAAT